jgi:iron complex outermembrane receptor protein
LFSISNAQTIKINGQIIAAGTNLPLSGVNIYIDNSSMGATSGENGNYQINNIPKSDITIIYSYIGYSEKRISFHAQSDTTINLKLSQTILDGPIVTTIATQAENKPASITFSDLNKNELSKRYDTQDIPELLSEMPSTTFYSEGGNGIGYSYLSIRGFDQRRISVLVNGIPQNDPEDHNVYWLDFPDLVENIQKIQVQRGAGNAFYGPAAIGGSINIKTDHFSPEAKLKVSFGMGSYNTKKYSLSYSSGLFAENYIVTTRVSNIKSDGYRDNAWVNFWSYFIGAAHYGKNNNLRIHFYGGPIEDGLAYGGTWNEYSGFGGIPKFLNNDDILRRKNWGYFEIDPQADSLIYTSDRRKDEIENFNQPHLEILHEWQLNNLFTINNSFFYTKGYGFFDYDGSWGDPAYFRLTPEFDYNVEAIPENTLIRAYVDNDHFGWLPQLTISSDKNEMIIGAEIRRHRSLHWGRLQKGSGLPQDVVGNGARRYYEYRGGKDIWSLYMHHNHRWNDELILQTDLQIAYKEYHIFDEKYLNNKLSIPYTFFNPRVGINYSFSQNQLAYFNMYNTSREPRLKNLYDAAESSGGELPQFELKENGKYNFNKPLVKPESLTGIEIGYNFKTMDLLEGTLNIFYMNFRDEIVKSGGVDRFGQPITGNAERTLHYGIEISSKVKLLYSLFLESNLTFSTNTFHSYKYYDSESFFIDNKIKYIAENDTTFYSDLRNNPIAGFPEFIGNLRLTYSWQDWYVSLSARYNGESFTDNFKNSKNKLDAYSLFNISANYNLKRFNLPMITIQAKINNLLNSKYLAAGEGIAFFPAATRHYFLTLKMEL